MRVLIVSYHYPPSRIVGALRPASFAKFLSEEGHDVRALWADNCGEAVITLPSGEPAPEGISEHQPCPLPADLGERTPRLPNLPARSKVLGAYQRVRGTLADWPDSGKVRSWGRRATVLGEQLIGDWKPDVVVSSANPITVHIIARSLSLPTHIPWVPDYRDLWSRNHYSAKLAPRRQIDERLERRWLRSAVAATTVSRASQLQELVPHAEVTTITNGFDESELLNIVPADLGPGTNLVYAGTWYWPRRDPTPIFDAMATQPGMGDVVVHLVGQRQPEVLASAERHGVAERVRWHGVVPRRRALELLAGADITLSLTWNDPGDAQVPTAKVYELVGLGNPVLNLGYEGGEVDRILRDSGIGVTANTPQSIAAAVQFLRHKDAIQSKSRPELYSRAVQSKKWSLLLQDVVAQSRHTSISRRAKCE